jgi:hypothetical protein
MFFPQLLLSLSFLFILSSALPSLPFYERTPTPSTPLPPSLDPFYTAPPHFALSPPGTILRLRTAPGNLTSIISNSSLAYNILYRTTNSRYSPSRAVTTIFLPLSSTLNTALLSYQIPYNTLNIDDSPSYFLYTLATGFPDIASALERGWVVSVPDFEGPDASSAAGIQEGLATLDSIRAVLSLSSEFGLSEHPSPRAAMWGYSGGAIPSEYAAELQTLYAPELEIAGVAIGGLPPNMKATFRTANGGPVAGVVPAGLLGITNQYPEAYGFVVSQLKSEGVYNKTGFLAVETMGFSEVLENYAFQDIFSYFVQGEKIMDAEVLRKPFEENGVMGVHGTPKMPLFVYKAIKDEASLVGETDSLVERYCDRGVNILYQRNELGGHMAEYYNGVERSFEWLDAVLGGTYKEMYNATGCTIQNGTWGSDSSPV